MSFEETPPPREGAREAGLFREEALSASQVRLGSPVRGLGVAGWVLTVFLVVVFAGVLVFAGVTQFARKETAVGVIQPAAGAIRVSTVRSGLISAVHVRDGQVVKGGTPLITLTLDPTIEGGRNLNALFEEAAKAQESALSDEGAANAVLLQREMENVDVRRNALRQQLANLHEQLGMQKQRVDLTRSTVDAAQKLYDQRYMPALQLRQRQDSLLAAEEEMTGLRKQQDQSRSDLSGLDVEAGKLRAQYADQRAQLARSNADLMEKRASVAGQGDIVLTAERDGRIASLLAKPGATAAPGATLAILLPQGSSLQAELWVPSKAIGFINIGEKVQLLYDAFPYQKFGPGHGQVTEIDDAPVGPQELPSSIESKEPLYRVVVALKSQTVEAYGRSWALLPGMKLNADIVLEKRSMLDWIMEPLIAMGARSR